MLIESCQWHACPLTKMIASIGATNPNIVPSSTDNQQLCIYKKNSFSQDTDSLSCAHVTQGVLTLVNLLK